MTIGLGEILAAVIAALVGAQMGAHDARIHPTEDDTSLMTIQVAEAKLCNGLDYYECDGVLYKALQYRGGRPPRTQEYTDTWSDSGTWFPCSTIWKGKDGRVYETEKTCR